MEQPAASQFYLCFPNRAFARAYKERVSSLIRLYESSCGADAPA